jgi:hypothetical protein
MPVAKERRTKVLVVANRTASTPRLLGEVTRRAKAQPTEFTLLIPGVRDRRTPDWTRETALELVSRAAREHVDWLPGGPDPFVAVRTAISHGDFDEIIISTLPRRVSKWLRRDLIRRVEGLGLPVTAIVPKGAKMSREDELLLGGAAGAGVGDIGLGGPRPPQGSGP